MKNRNYTIELFRFIFAINIMIFHYWLGGFSNSNYFRNGYIGVEFFFIVNGYFMAESAKNYKNSQVSVWINNIDYIKKRIKGFIIPCIIVQIFSFIMQHIILFKNSFSIKQLIMDMLSFPFDILLLRQWGFCFKYYNGVTWYLSAMLVVMLVCFPLLIKYKEKYTHYIAPIITLSILGIFSHVDGRIDNTTAYWGIIYKSTLRAFAIINLGVIINTICTKLLEIRIGKTQKNILLIIQGVSFFIPLYYSIADIETNLQFECLFFMSIGIAVSFFNILHFDIFNNIITKLGKMSLYIFISHYPIALYVMPYLKIRGGIGLAAYVIISIIFSLFVFFLDNRIKKLILIKCTK